MTALRTVLTLARLLLICAALGLFVGTVAASLVHAFAIMLRVI